MAQHRGHLIKTTGDGMLATFDGPGRAIRCALAFEAAARRIGLPVRDIASDARSISIAADGRACDSSFFREAPDGRWAALTGWFGLATWRPPGREGGPFTSNSKLVGTTRETELFFGGSRRQRDHIAERRSCSLVVTGFEVAARARLGFYHLQRYQGTRLAEPYFRPSSRHIPSSPP